MRFLSWARPLAAGHAASSAALTSIVSFRRVVLTLGLAIVVAGAFGVGNRSALQAQENAEVAEELPTIDVEVTEPPQDPPPSASNNDDSGPAYQTTQSSGGNVDAEVEDTAGADVSEAGDGPNGPVNRGDTTNRGTSGIDGYTATGTSTATKTNTAIINIPQTVTVVTEEFIQDTGAYSVGRALEYVPGVTVQQGEGHRDQITIRGQETNADFFTDGVRDDIQYYRDLYNVEALEVLKGSTAMVFGRGGGGGVVNRVTKKANGESIYYGSATFGSYGKKYFTADVGQAVTPNFAVRLNAMYEDSEGFRDFFQVERVGFNPTATIKLGPKTNFLASYEYRSDDRTVDRGVPSRNGFPIEGFQKTFFGNPEASFTEFEGHVATATFEHEFDFGPTLRSHFSYNNYDKFYQNIMPGSSVADGGTFLVGGSATDNDAGGYSNDTQRESYFSQTDVSHKFNTGSLMRHTLLAGMEFSNQDQTNIRHVPFFPETGTPGLTLSLNNPTTFAPVQFNERTRNRLSDVTNRGFYLQDQIEITKYLEIIGGIRHDTFEIDFEEADDDIQISRTDKEWSPRAGVIVKPLESLSVYASWSKSFLPTSGDQFDNLTISRADLAPEEFENREVGLKWAVTPRLFFTAALFDLDRTNQRVTVNGIDVAAGQTNTKGGEVGLVGYITDEWEINLGYSNQRSKIENAGDNVAIVGNSVEGVPRHIFSMWNRYQLTQMFGAGVGIVHQSDHFASSNNAVEVPGFTRVDAALFFDLNENWSAQLNVENVFDRDYFASAHNNNNISPGAPRSAYVTVRAKF